MLTKTRFASIFLALLVLVALMMPVFALAAEDGLIVPNCDPAVLPKDGGNPCGLGAFAEMIFKIIGYLRLIIVPIATVMIGYAGFLILTSGGNAEKTQKGYGMIKIAATGIILLLAAYLVVQFIFNALNVGQGIGGVK